MIEMAEGVLNLAELGDNFKEEVKQQFVSGLTDFIK
jgi:hypothetical protein